MGEFDEHYRQVVAEAKAEGRHAVDELHLLETKYGLGGSDVARRHELGMTQKQLAAASGVRQGEISRIEGGSANPTVRTLSALATALGLELRPVIK